MFNAETLVDYLEDRIRSNDARARKATGAARISCPLFFLLFGRSSIDHFDRVANGMYRIWPQYRKKFCFVGVLSGINGTSFVLLDMDRDGTIKELPVTSAEASAHFGQLYSDIDAFDSFQRCMVSYVVDTSRHGVGEFARWLESLRDVKQALGLNRASGMDELAFVLLDESFGAEILKAQDVRDELHKRLTGSGNLGNLTVLLLSNRMRNKAVLGERERLFDIVPLVVSMSVASGNSTRSFLTHDVITAAYLHREKPIREIATTVVRDIVKVLDNIVAARDDAVSLDAKDLRSRLGMDEDGCFDVLSAFAQREAFPLLPTPEQLDLFPRREPQERNLALGASGFDEDTLGSWFCYVDECAKRAEERLQVPGDRLRELCDSYKSAVRETLSAREIAMLGTRKTWVQEEVLAVSSPPIPTSVLDSGRLRICNSLSTSDSLRNALMNELWELSDKARSFLNDTWPKLVQSSTELPMPIVENVESFYGVIVERFANSHADELEQGIFGVFDDAGLQRFLEKTLDDVYDDSPVFALPFEREAIVRHNSKGDEELAVSSIASSIRAKEQNTYLDAIYSLGAPLAESVFLKAGTELDTHLKHQKSEGRLSSFLYDTGDASAAESLAIFRVGADYLQNKKDMQ